MDTELSARCAIGVVLPGEMSASIGGVVRDVAAVYAPPALPDELQAAVAVRASIRLVIYGLSRRHERLYREVSIKTLPGSKRF